MTSGKANRTFFVEDMESRQTNVGDFFFGHKDVGGPHFGIGIGGPHTGARRARQCHQANPDCGDELAMPLLFRFRGLLDVFLLSVSCIPTMPSQDLQITLTLNAVRFIKFPHGGHGPWRRPQRRPRTEA